MKKITKVYKRDDDRGIFLECINGETAWRSINSGFMKAGAVMGNHYHKDSQTFFFLLSGSAEVYYRNVQTTTEKDVKHFTLQAEEGVVFEPYETHAWKFQTDAVFLLLKTETYHKDEPDTYEGKVL